MAPKSGREAEGVAAEKRMQHMAVGQPSLTATLLQREVFDMLEEAGVPLLRGMKGAPAYVDFPAPNTWDTWDQSRPADLTASELDQSTTFLRAELQHRGRDVRADTFSSANSLVILAIEGLPSGEFIALVPHHVWAHATGWDRGFHNASRRRESAVYTWSRWAVANGFQVHRTHIKEAIWNVLQIEKPYVNPTTKLVIQPQDWPGRQLVPLSTLPLPHDFNPEHGAEGVVQLHQENSAYEELEEDEPEADDVERATARVELAINSLLVRPTESPDSEDHPSLFLFPQPPGHPECTHVCMPLQLTAEEKERFHTEGVNPRYLFSPGMADISGFPVNLMLMQQHRSLPHENQHYIEIPANQWTFSRTARNIFFWGCIDDNMHLLIPSSQTRYHEHMQPESASNSPLPCFSDLRQTQVQTKKHAIPLKDFLRVDYEYDLKVLSLQGVADKLVEEFQKLKEPGDATVEPVKLAELTQAGWDLGLSISG